MFVVRFPLVLLWQTKCGIVLWAVPFCDASDSNYSGSFACVCSFSVAGVTELFVHSQVFVPHYTATAVELQLLQMTCTIVTRACVRAVLQPLAASATEKLCVQNWLINLESVTPLHPAAFLVDGRSFPANTKKGMVYWRALSWSRLATWKSILKDFPP